MDLQGFNNEFDLFYNNLTSNATPALDIYEKSVFLTRAQEELTIELYTGKSREYSSFESNEELRRYLDILVKPLYVNLSGYPTATDDNDINANFSGLDSFYNYRIDLITLGYTDILYPIYEAAVFDITQLPDEFQTNYIESADVEIKPIKHTEYHSIIRNPFKRPNTNRVHRVDSSLSGTSIFDIELVSMFLLSGYRMRYIKIPQPIILDDLAQYNLNINGVFVATDCELPSILHPEIVKKAAYMAARVYKNSQ